MGRPGWSIGGRRVELQARVFRRDGLVVIGAAAVDGPVGGLEVELEGRTFVAKQDRLKHWELWCDDALVPSSPAHVPQVPAPADATCPAHRAAASHVCPRCGTFFCGRCRSLDLTHCEACVAQLQAADRRESLGRRIRDPMVLVGVVASALLGGGRVMLLLQLAVLLVTRAMVLAVTRDAPTERAAKWQAGGIYLGSFGLIFLLAWFGPELRALLSGSR